MTNPNPLPQTGGAWRVEGGKVVPDQQDAPQKNTADPKSPSHQDGKK